MVAVVTTRRLVLVFDKLRYIFKPVERNGHIIPDFQSPISIHITLIFKVVIFFEKFISLHPEESAEIKIPDEFHT
jgi:hypothetical protein